MESIINSDGLHARHSTYKATLRNTRNLFKSPHAGQRHHPRDTPNLTGIEKMERETGIEPATSSLGSWRSTAELLPPTGMGNCAGIKQSLALAAAAHNVFEELCGVHNRHPAVEREPALSFRLGNE